MISPGRAPPEYGTARTRWILSVPSGKSAYAPGQGLKPRTWFSTCAALMVKSISPISRLSMGK